MMNCPQEQKNDASQERAMQQYKSIVDLAYAIYDSTKNTFSAKGPEKIFLCVYLCSVMLFLLHQHGRAHRNGEYHYNDNE